MIIMIINRYKQFIYTVIFLCFIHIACEQLHPYEHTFSKNDNPLLKWTDWREQSPANDGFTINKGKFPLNQF